MIGPLVVPPVTRQVVEPLSNHKGWVLLAGNMIVSFTWAAKVNDPPVAVVPPLAV